MDDADFQKIVDNLDDYDRVKLKAAIQYIAQCFSDNTPYTGILIVGNHETRESTILVMAMDTPDAVGLMSHAMEKMMDAVESEMHIPKEKKH